METVNQVQDRIIEEFAMFDDWMDRYEYLIQLGGEMPPLEAEVKIQKYIIEGCQSRVWLVPEYRDGLLYFRADSDAEIPKGIISLLLQVLSGRTPGEIVESDLYFIQNTGLSENLSPTRSNGLVQMVKQMKLYAAAYVAQEG